MTVREFLLPEQNKLGFTRVWVEVGVIEPENSEFTGREWELTDSESLRNGQIIVFDWVDGLTNNEKRLSGLTC